MKNGKDVFGRGKFLLSRRQILKGGLIGGTAVMIPWRFMRKAFAATQGPGLSDPAMQPKFSAVVPNALDPGFIYDTSKGKIKVAVGQTVQMTGLVGTDGVTPVPDYRLGLRRRQILYVAWTYVPDSKLHAS